MPESLLSDQSKSRNLAEWPEAAALLTAQRALLLAWWKWLTSTPAPSADLARQSAADLAGVLAQLNALQFGDRR